MPGAEGQGGATGGSPSQTPKGGVQTGGGATSGVEHVAVFGMGGLALIGAGALGFAARRRREV